MKKMIEAVIDIETMQTELELNNQPRNEALDVALDSFKKLEKIKVLVKPFATNNVSKEQLKEELLNQSMNDIMEVMMEFYNCISNIKKEME